LPSLKVAEIFYSIQGETTRVGLPTVFVRLNGCPIRCSWCDTEYAFKGGQVFEILDIIDKIKSFPTRYVTITGGEPLAQNKVHDLIGRLCDLGYKLNIETGGMLQIADVDKRAVVTLDIKPPGSGEEASNHWQNLEHLKKGDEVKIVIKNRDDYLWVKSRLKQMPDKVEVLLSAVAGSLNPAELADWILADGLKARLQVQLHKILWHEARGR
jgi:7-carboxy-7-deazaguanine synthase